MDRNIKRALPTEVYQRLGIDTGQAFTFNRHVEQMVHLNKENLARYIGSLGDAEQTALREGFTKLIGAGQDLDKIEFTTLLGDSHMATGDFKVERKSKLSDIWTLLN